jgi:hypothetical protein
LDIQSDHARLAALDFFERVRFGVAPPSPYVWRVLDSCAAAQQLCTEPVIRGHSYVGLRRRFTDELMSHVDALRPGSAKTLRECAWDAAVLCAEHALERSSGRLVPWREHVTADALGIFLCLRFRGSAEARLFFALVRAGYQSRGVPCGLPGWPASQLAIYCLGSESAKTARRVGRLVGQEPARRRAE